MAKIVNPTNKTPIAIAFSDLHLEIWKQHNEGNRRLENAKDVLRKIKLLCKKHRVISLFPGDLFHKEKSLSNELLFETLPFFKKLWEKGDFVTVAISGNHDQTKQNLIGNESPSYIKTLSKTFDGFKCIDFSSYKLNDEVMVYGVPYITHDLGLIDYINSIDLKLSNKNILMLHTTMPNAKDTDGREVHSNLHQTEFYKALERFDLVLCGHIHSPFYFHVGLTNIVQVGAPQQQRLTDKNCKMGYWLIYDDLEVEFVHFSKYPRFIEISDYSEKINDGNFYVIKPKKKERKGSTEVRRKFDNSNSKSKLARNYLKQKGIKDKAKKEALIQILKSIE